MKPFSWFSNNAPAQENSQILRNSQALENMSACVMMADQDRVIVYANNAVRRLLKELETEIRQELPTFSADNLVGQSIDQFHQNPAHQKGILANLRSEAVSNIKVGKINFKLTLVPLFDDQGQNIGTSVEWVDVTQQLINQGKLDAIDRSQAAIEFDLQGNIQFANENFLSAMGYSLDEIKGKHHGIFVDPEYRNSLEYKQFWEKLNRGEFESGEYRRFTKTGREIWIQASYNPVMDAKGKPIGVVKYATDITEQKLRNSDFEGQIEAIGKSQAVIEFDVDGIIQHANENFLDAMGYTLDQIKGKHHSMFVEPDYKNSREYSEFWDQLKRGQFSAGEYKRITKDGSEIWIQASYNPILDMNGTPIKVVKYATDITGRKVAVNEVKNTLLKLSKGDLTCKIEREFDGEFIELKNAINEFVEELNNMISEIRMATTTINGAANEISQGNSDLSSRTEQQASSLEETASSMEELTGTVRLNAENASQANGLASQASDVAKNGGELIERVVVTMSSINESAKKISDIIGVIDGIAFQTNILALNAAVEAARAGEQGRGFAVVASEVRTLAQRSANAAKDIKELISDSVEKVESGNALVNQSGDTMQEIVTSIQRVNDIMSEIAAASNEQASGIDEIGKAVTQMDEMTQQNAALVEQAAAAAESLSSQADQLAQRVDTFKLDASLINDDVVPLPTRRLQESRKTSHEQPIVKKAKVLSSAPDEDEWESF